jgi:hypothetical protein
MECMMMSQKTPTLPSQAPAFAEDLLEGADAIASFMFGEGADRRRVYYLLDRGLPHFRLGNRIFGRRSSLLKWIEQQEAAQGRAQVA